MSKKWSLSTITWTELLHTSSFPHHPAQTGQQKKITKTKIVNNSKTIRHVHNQAQILLAMNSTEKSSPSSWFLQLKQLLFILRSINIDGILSLQVSTHLSISISFRNRLISFADVSFCDSISRSLSSHMTSW